MLSLTLQIYLLLKENEIFWQFHFSKLTSKIHNTVDLISSPELDIKKIYVALAR